MAITPWWPSEVCKHCSRQVLVVSITGVIIAVTVVAILLLGNLLA